MIIFTQSYHMWYSVQKKEAAAESAVILLLRLARSYPPSRIWTRLSEVTISQFVPVKITIYLGGSQEA